MEKRKLRNTRKTPKGKQSHCLRTKIKSNETAQVDRLEEKSCVIILAFQPSAYPPVLLCAFANFAYFVV
jgi:hypothetical protein